MIDENFKVYLIEVNTNPSLEICCPLLARIIPELLDNSMRIAIDPIYQPQFIANENIITPSELPQKLGRPVFDYPLPTKEEDLLLKKSQGQNKQRRRLDMASHLKYTLVFDDRIDAKELEELFQSNPE